MSTRTPVGATQTFTAANGTGLQALANMYIAQDPNAAGNGYVVVTGNVATMAFTTAGTLYGYTTTRTGGRRWAQVLVGDILNTGVANSVGVAEAVSTTGNGYAAILKYNGTGGATQADLQIRRFAAGGAAAGVLVQTVANLAILPGTPISIEYDSATGVVEVYRDPEAAPITTYTDTSPLPDGHSGIWLAGVANGASGDDLTQGTWSTGGGGDTTAPTLSSPTGTGGTLAATGTVSTNEAGGTLYYLVSANATETAPAQGSAMTGWSSQAVTATGTQNVSATGLTAGTRYLHYVHDDAAGNRSARVSSASFTVAASGGGTTYSLVCARMANNTGAGKKVSTTFTGVLVYGGDFNDLAGKTLHSITSTAVNADGDATLTGLPQTGAAMLLRKWADGARSVEFVTVS